MKPCGVSLIGTVGYRPVCPDKKPPVQTEILQVLCTEAQS